MGTNGHNQPGDTGPDTAALTEAMDGLAAQVAGQRADLLAQARPVITSIQSRTYAVGETPITIAGMATDRIALDVLVESGATDPVWVSGDRSGSDSFGAARLSPGQHLTLNHSGPVMAACASGDGPVTVSVIETMRRFADTP